jgi:dihydrolipoamide dehydrogenase
LIVGGGYIGMELGTVYATLGSEVVVAEALDSILLGADADLARPVAAWAKKNFKEVRLKARVTKMSTAGKQINVVMEFDGKSVEELYDRVLVAVGRKPNSTDLGLEHTKATLDDKGFIVVNEKQQTSDPAIYAIGDIAGGVLLAHKASREARVAVEIITGEATSANKSIIPAVVFTDPEVAWCGLTEAEAKAKQIPFEVARFSWAASGRALTLDRTDGLTKLIDRARDGAHPRCGNRRPRRRELIGEGVLAVEMGATARDLSLCVHPHPTLSETLMESAEAFYGHATHIYTRKPAA